MLYCPLGAKTWVGRSEIIFFPPLLKRFLGQSQRAIQHFFFRPYVAAILDYMKCFDYVSLSNLPYQRDHRVCRVALSRWQTPRSSYRPETCSKIHLLVTRAGTRTYPGETNTWNNQEFKGIDQFWKRPPPPSQKRNGSSYYQSCERKCFD